MIPEKISSTTDSDYELVESSSRISEQAEKELEVRQTVDNTVHRVIKKTRKNIKIGAYYGDMWAHQLEIVKNDPNSLASQALKIFGPTTGKVIAAVGSFIVVKNDMRKEDEELKNAIVKKQE